MKSSIAVLVFCILGCIFCAVLAIIATNPWIKLMDAALCVLNIWNANKAYKSLQVLREYDAWKKKRNSGGAQV